jgi:hypothetical protein
LPFSHVILTERSNSISESGGASAELYNDECGIKICMDETYIAFHMDFNFYGQVKKNIIRHERTE